MIETKIIQFAIPLMRLQELKGIYDLDAFDDWLEPASVLELSSQIDKLGDACEKSKFRNALMALITTRQWLNDTGASSHHRRAAQSEIAHVVNAVCGEFDDRVFYQLSPDRAKYFDQEKLLGDAVDVAFPSARYDIREAGNCMATERNTAAVFHLMRAVEWGLRALCGHLGMRQAKRPKKAGQKSYVPLAWAEWEALLNQLSPRVDARINKLKRGSQKQAEQEFYYPVLQDIRGIRDAWRNHVMHTRREYKPGEATVVFENVERIMTTLAKRIKDPVEAVKRPNIRQAKYGVGGLDYLDVTEILRGYVAGDVEVLASNHFFSDPYPERFKHLVVKFTAPGSKTVKTLTFTEGQPVRFAK